MKIIFICVDQTVYRKYIRTLVVYKISCKDCNAYMGQTARKDIVEHRNLNHLHKNTTHFVITEYRRSNHEFDWNRVEILDRESV